MNDGSLHPSEYELIAFNRGQLEETELCPIAAHLDECLACCGRLRELSSADEVLSWLRQTARQEMILDVPEKDRPAARTEPSQDGAKRAFLDRTPNEPPPLDGAPAPLPTHIGDYEILAEVGRGGMGVVYKARQRRLNRLAAVKMILAQEHASAEQSVRFQREAELAAQVRHTNVVQVYEAGTQGDRPFIAMEWVEGGTLARQLDHKPMPSREAARLLETLARAVHAAHTQGVLHRDLKPANILLQAHGVPPVGLGTAKITDFGLARPLTSGFGLTQSGTVLGTPEYMAPEQATGRGSDVGPAADVYSLGAILYELLTGRPPFTGATALDTLEQVKNQDPVPPARLNSRLPPDLDNVCLKCLRKEPGERYDSAQALADDLGRWLAGEPVLARPVWIGRRLVKWARRRPTGAALVALLLVATPALLTGIVLVQRAQDARVRDTDAASRADELVQSLARSDTKNVPQIVRELAPYQHWAAPRLEDTLARCSPGSKEELHVRLALLPWQPEHVGALQRRLLSSSVDEFEVIRDSLRPHADELAPALARVLHDTGQPVLARFRAAMALAAYEPEQPDSWPPELLTFLASQMSAARPDDQRGVRRSVAPAARRLVPALVARFRDATARASVREAAAYALVEFVDDQPEELARLACEGTPAQYDILYPALSESQGHREAAKVCLLRILDEPVPPADQQSEEQRVRQGRRRALAAVTLLRLGQPQGLHSLFRVTDDPESLTQFVHRHKDCGVVAPQLLSCLKGAWQVQRDKDDPTHLADRTLYALLLALGEHRLEDVPREECGDLIDQLGSCYKEHPSSAVHSAAGWLLRRWGKGMLLKSLDERKVEYNPNREWFVRQVGGDWFTFVVFPAGRFRMGSPSGKNRQGEADREDDESLHGVRISRPFALSDREVSPEQFQKLTRLAEVEKSPAAGWGNEAERTWYQAVLVCRWLTREAKLDDEQCYKAPEQLAGREEARSWPYDPGKRGFRLPTEAEWEYACRCGGLLSTFGFGSDRELLTKYAWIKDNSGGEIHPGGQLRPSLRGLFDMHGNLAEWCFDWYHEDYLEDPAGPTHLIMQTLGAHGLAPAGAPAGALAQHLAALGLLEADAFPVRDESPNDVTNPVRSSPPADSDNGRVIRGGSAKLYARLARSAHRDIPVPARRISRSQDIGFRLAVTLPTPTPLTGP